MMTSAYTLHHETTDATLHEAFHAVATKREALRIARRCARMAGPDVARIIVCDREESTVAAFNTSTLQALVSHDGTANQF